MVDGRMIPELSLTCVERVEILIRQNDASESVGRTATTAQDARQTGSDGHSEGVGEGSAGCGRPQEIRGCVRVLSIRVGTGLESGADFHGGSEAIKRSESAQF